jgi:hypothetical protein
MLDRWGTVLAAAVNVWESADENVAPALDPGSPLTTL